MPLRAIILAAAMLATVFTGPVFISAPVAADEEAARAAIAPFTARRVVDLTHPLHPEMPFWPGGVPFRMTRLADYDQGYRAHKFEIGENTGTHLDAPSHFVADGRDIDGVRLAELVAPAVVIDVTTQAARNPDFRLSETDILAFEAAHGPIREGVWVLVNTGWHKRFDDPDAYANADAGGMHFPGLDVSAARLLAGRGIAGIGIDTFSIDPGTTVDFAAHKAILGAGRYQLENLANLDVLPATGVTLVIGVLPVAGGTQAQARVLAFLP